MAEEPCLTLTDLSRQSGVCRSSRASAGSRVAARTPSIVLPRRLGQVDAGEGREGGEPREAVAELLLQVLPVLLAEQRARELADLLDEPGERAVDSARAVSLEVDRLDAPLELFDFHGRDSMFGDPAMGLLAALEAHVDGDGLVRGALDLD